MYLNLFNIKALSMRRLVILFSICLVKCLAMSRSELEEFSNFLEVTSQLDLNLKSKGPDDEYDEDAPISDNAWEESGKFEGDLILNERQRRLLIADVAEGLSRNGLQDSTKRWPNNELIYYIQREHFTDGQMQAIQAGIDDLAQVSCVKFTPYRKGDRDAVVIQGSRRGCFSQVGYQGGYQVLNLSGRHPVGRGCFRHGTVVHELLHSLGFYHMQSSPDRDDYIDVVWQNIIKPARHNFRKYNLFAVNDFGVGYDYESVLHYSRKAFSSNGQDTLVPKQPGAEIGQRVGLSQKDIQKLNKMYCDIDLNDSNNADSDITPHKPVTKKKKPKNKPFDGHGIGYHQGKAVVIKLEPTVELLRLPTLPKFHAFDYFSNEQPVLPPTLTETSGGERKMIYISTKSAHTDELHRLPTNKALTPNMNKDRHLPTTPLSVEDKTFVRPVSEEKQNEVPSTHQKNFNDVPDYLDSEIGVAFGKISNEEKTQSNPANIYLIKQSGRHIIPENHIHDYTKDRATILPPEFKQYSRTRYGQNKADKKYPSFLPHVHTTYEPRTLYPLRELSYDTYQSTIPESKSFLNHYLSGDLSHSNPTVGDYSSLTKDLPVYEDRSNKYNYDPSSNFYGNYPYTS